MRTWCRSCTWADSTTASTELRRVSSNLTTREVLATLPAWDSWNVRWSPDGRHFHFTSAADNEEHAKMHVCDLETGAVTHGLRRGLRPEWSRDGRTVVSAAGETKHRLEELEFPAP